MCTDEQCVFESGSSIDELLKYFFETVPGEIMKNIEINFNVVKAIKELEEEDFFNQRPVVITIKENYTESDFEFIINELIHCVYRECELQKQIYNSRKIDMLVEQLEKKEAECEAIKKEIIKISL